MAASRQDISEWFNAGVEQGATHMIVVCDTFDFEDYPVYITPDQNVKERAKEYYGENMQRIMEVYNLSIDKESQLNAYRVFNY